MNALILVGAVRVCQREILLETPARIAIITISLLFSTRSMLAVFNNQQTDILIFGLMVFGLAAYVRRPLAGASLMALAVALKANPLFMILLPAFKKRWSMVAVFLLVTVGLIVAPDIAKYAVTDTWTESEFTVPGVGIGKERHRSPRSFQGRGGRPGSLGLPA